MRLSKESYEDLIEKYRKGKISKRVFDYIEYKYYKKMLENTLVKFIK